MKHAHLVKVFVQSVWVVIDDETGAAEEQTDTGSFVPAAAWPDFYKQHCADFAVLQKTIEAESAEPTPNRAARRAKRPPPEV